jgi:HAD superfamily hydrolase (TIGR01662 family)
VTAAALFDRRFALLDRDGTIIIDKIYLSDPKDIEFAPFAIEGLRLLRDAGARLILLTNQSGIARGYFSEEPLPQFVAACARCSRRKAFSWKRSTIVPTARRTVAAAASPRPVWFWTRLGCGTVK